MCGCIEIIQEGAERFLPANDGTTCLVLSVVSPVQHSLTS